MYCSNISRTYLVDPNKTQEAQYKALLEAHEAAIHALQPGKPMSDAYAAVVQTLQVVLLARQWIALQSCSSNLPS